MEWQSLPISLFCKGGGRKPYLIGLNLNTNTSVWGRNMQNFFYEPWPHVHCSYMLDKNRLGKPCKSIQVFSSISIKCIGWDRIFIHFSHDSKNLVIFSEWKKQYLNLPTFIELSSVGMFIIIHARNFVRFFLKKRKDQRKATIESRM